MDLKVTQLGMYRAGETTTITKDNFGALASNRSYYEYYSGRSHQLPLKETPRGKTRVYVSVKGENIWDDMSNRTSRPHTLWAPIVKAALIEAGWPADVKLRWSQKAGCSCPCSPAFFVTGGPLGLDLWATVEADELQADPEVASFRRAQLVADPTLPVTA